MVSRDLLPMAGHQSAAAAGAQIINSLGIGPVLSHRRREGPLGKSWPKEELEIGKRQKLQGYLALRCIGNNVI
jgi:hypothetical protein